MIKEAVFTMKLEPELREQFVAAAQAVHRPASQVMRELMREFVERQKAQLEHDRWIRSEIERGLQELSDPNVRVIPNEVVEAEWDIKRAELIKRVASRSE